MEIAITAIEGDNRAKTPTPRKPSSDDFVNTIPGGAQMPIDAFIDDDAWHEIATLLEEGSQGSRGGRPRASSRSIFDALLYLSVTHVSWHQLPSSFPPASTVRGRLKEWRESGVLVRIPLDLLSTYPEGTIEGWRRLITTGTASDRTAAEPMGGTPRGQDDAQVHEVRATHLAELRTAELRAFQLTKELGSFSGAARVLGYSESTIHHQVRQLEAVLKVPLMVFKDNQLSLTEQGRFLQTAISDVLSAVDRLEQSTRSVISSESVRIGCGRATGVSWVIPFVARFYDALDAKINLRMGDALSLSRMLVDGSIDVAISAVIDAYFTDGELAAYKLRKSLLRNDRWILVRSASGARDQFYITDNLSVGRSSKVLALLRDAVGDARISNLSSAEAVHQACLAGLGTGVLPELTAREDLIAGNLVRIAEFGAAGELPIYLIHRWLEFMNPASRRVLDVLVREADWNRD